MSSVARRLLLRASLAVLLAQVALPGFARTDCAPGTAAGTERCVIGLSAVQVTQLHQQQRASDWCWAAVISMIFRHHGAVLPQDAVVRAQFGRTANQGATASEITALINRTWRDAEGRAVAAETAPLPAWRSQRGIAAPEVIGELGDGRPVIVGVENHAMVLVQLVVDRDVDDHSGRSLRIVRAVVLDPARDVGLRSLRGTELRPEFVARVSVHVEGPVTADAGEPAAPRPLVPGAVARQDDQEVPVSTKS